MRTVEIIAAKRDGKELPASALQQLIDGFVAGTVPDYQMAAFAMAVVWRGMTAAETAALLEAMLKSGDEVSWDDLGVPTADKHSTGGVGDKVSIPLAPAVAACGVAVPMISGRGLGHTGGTLDKLESIRGPGRDGSGKGFETRLSLDDFRELVRTTGMGMIGQTERIVPADKKLYALRDVTATVESIPLIVASILSKKLAEGAGALVLDVKVGSGAFMKTREDALALATAMVKAGQAAGRKVTAFLTAMDRPLGTHIGNALEIAESVEILRGGGPDDTRQEVVRLGGEMLRLAGRVATLAEGEAAIAAVLDNGAALGKFREMVQAQGGDPRVADDPWSVLERAPVVLPLRADGAGTVLALDALQVGLAAVRLGAGRNRSEDEVDMAVGFILHKKPGSHFLPGEIMAEIHARTPEAAEAAAAELRRAFVVGEGQPDLLPLWLDVVH
ncbi:MAG: thymidine phosphorylase [Deltaproteobacteria bacterium]|nr:thymidine phosphorylase [Deltaproteobacteria bacterium]